LREGIEVTVEDERERRPVRVALSNDYELSLLGLAQMLARYPSEVRIVDMTTLVEMPHQADIILFDTFGRLPDHDAKLQRVVNENTAKVVVYSWEHYPEEDARRQGAVGYLPKSMKADDLVRAIVAIHEGNNPGQSSSDAAEDPALSWPGQVLGLTQRESEMLTLIARGLTNAEIASRSYIGINTVKTYVRTAYQKIGVRNRAEAVAWGFENGFRSVDGTPV
jgi:DNA-binding NarL/FixJ family response regulator